MGDDGATLDMWAVKDQQPDDETIRRAGQRAWDWWIDTGGCFFCDVDSAPRGARHEAHCTFYRHTKER